MTKPFRAAGRQAWKMLWTVYGRHIPSLNELRPAAPPEKRRAAK